MSTLTASVLNFPTAEDRESLKTAIETWLASRVISTRDQIGKHLKFRLREFGVSRMVVHNYIVSLDPKGNLKINTKPTLLGNYCKCGQYIYGDDSKVKILYIRENRGSDAVTYGCQVCGLIFTKTEQVGDC